MTAQIALDEITRLAVEVRAAVDEIEYQAQLAREDLAAEEPAPEPEPSPETYTVQAGDTLSGIATAHGMTTDELAEINGITDPNTIYVGQVLRLVAETPEEPTTPEPTLVPQNYTVTVDDAANTVTLSWDAVPGATEYVIYEDNFHGSRSLTATITETTSTRGPLQDDFTYAYAVAAVVDGVEYVTEAVDAVLGQTTEEPPAEEEPPVDEEPPPAAGDDPVPAGSALIFDGLFDSTGFSNYSNMQNGDHNGSPSSMDRAQLLEDPERGTICRFTVSPGDVPDFGGGERSEVRASDAADTRAGDELWYRFAVKFDEGFYEESSWFIIMQWHAGSGSPPLCVQAEGDNLVLANNRDWSQNRTIGPIVHGQWVEYVIHALFANDGWAEVYQDGNLVLERHNRSTLVTDHNYLKLGIYRDEDSDTDAVEHTGVEVYRS